MIGHVLIQSLLQRYLSHLCCAWSGIQTRTQTLLLDSEDSSALCFNRKRESTVITSSKKNRLSYPLIQPPNMCIPYIISDPPPPRKRPLRGSATTRAPPPKPTRLQPAFIEISPRLTYVASPKPNRSPIPPQRRRSAMKPPRAPNLEILQCLVDEEQPSRQKEEKFVEEMAKSAASRAPVASPMPTEPEASFKPSPPLPPPQLPPAAPPQDPLPSHQPPPPPTDPKERQSPQPPPPTPRTQNPLHHHHPPPPTRSPFVYTHRPPPPPLQRTRSLPSEPLISRRSFERLKRNCNVLWERIKVLEAEKEVWEGRRRGRSRREGSLRRERRERGRGEERWDWEGGGLGRR